MSYLVANLPPVKCLVRAEYLYDLEPGHEDQYVSCYWVTVKSIPGKALYFEALLENGTLYDKLPLSAFAWKPLEDYVYPLDHLEIWDAFSYHITVVQKALLKNTRVKVYTKAKELVEGTYLFTIDSCHSDPNVLNTTLSETPDEHKSFNIIRLDNGQFAAQPNNRVIFHDQSLTPAQFDFPGYKVSTKEFICEQSTKWAVDQESFDYEPPAE